jgi:taurine transport system permease protein
MSDFLFEQRNTIVAFLIIGLLVSLALSVLKGRQVMTTERTDLVFGNPAKALGGWYWIVTGMSFVMLIWFYFSWDAARAYNPTAANELCQVAKVESAINPNLRGTDLIARDSAQLERINNSLQTFALEHAAEAEISAILASLTSALVDQANPAYLKASLSTDFQAITARIDSLTADFNDPAFPGPPTAAQQAAANAQPGWGDTGKEVPVLPATPLGYRYAAIAAEMKVIAKDFVRLRNTNPHLLAQIADIKSRIKAAKASTKANLSLSTAEQEDRDTLYSQLNKMLKRIDNGSIFPPSSLNGVQSSLVAFDQAHIAQQGSLKAFDTWMMPGGRIMAGNTACSEQGSGRWLPKPSDTLGTLARIANPDIGFKDVPLLWYRWQPVGGMIAFLFPDWIADLVPGEYPRHNQNGDINSNFKSNIQDFVTGNYDSFSIPVPMGHMWDSIVRVVIGLFFGIVLGVPLGLFMGLSRFAKGFFDPMIELYRPVPPLAWAPLILTIFGIQDDGKIFLLFMVAFAIMVISARTGATGTQLSKIHAAHSLGANRRQILRRVIFPNSLPEILTGIRIAIGVCWGTLVAAEMLAGTTGIGFVENVARKQSDYEVIWVTIIILGVLGLMFDLIMRSVIKRTIPWRGKG